MPFLQLKEDIKTQKKTSTVSVSSCLFDAGQEKAGLTWSRPNSAPHHHFTHHHHYHFILTYSTFQGFAFTLGLLFL